MCGGHTWLFAGVRRGHGNPCRQWRVASVLSAGLYAHGRQRQSACHFAENLYGLDNQCAGIFTDGGVCSCHNTGAEKRESDSRTDALAAGHRRLCFGKAGCERLYRSARWYEKRPSRCHRWRVATVAGVQPKAQKRQQDNARCILRSVCRLCGDYSGYGPLCVIRRR